MTGPAAKRRHLVAQCVSPGFEVLNDLERRRCDTHIEQVPALAGLGDPFGYGHALTDVATNYRPFGPLEVCTES